MCSYKHHGKNNLKYRVEGQWMTYVYMTKVSMKFSWSLLGCRSYPNTMLDVRHHLCLGISIGRFLFGVIEAGSYIPERIGPCRVLEAFRLRG